MEAAVSRDNSQKHSIAEQLTAVFQIDLPNHMVRSSGPLTLMKLAWHSLAIALANSVFPQPAHRETHILSSTHIAFSCKCHAIKQMLHAEDVLLVAVASLAGG